MIQSPEIEKIAAALVAVQAAVPKIPKDATNPFFKSHYADLPAVIEKAAPILAQNQLAVSQLLGFDGEHDTLTTLVIHSSGQYVGDTARLFLKNEDSQGHGSATTYLRRYAYMAALGLVADEDDDGNAASTPPTSRRESPRPAATAGAFLTVPFKDKDAVKALGARWDGQAKSWYVPVGIDVEPFAKWLTEASADEPPPYDEESF